MRVVVGSDAHGPAVVPDTAGTAPGRGAHLHPTIECLELAVRRRALPRALRVQGGLGAEPVRTHINALDSNRD